MAALMAANIPVTVASLAGELVVLGQARSCATSRRYRELAAALDPSVPEVPESQHDHPGNLSRTSVMLRRHLASEVPDIPELLAGKGSDSEGESAHESSNDESDHEDDGTIRPAYMYGGTSLRDQRTAPQPPTIFSAAVPPSRPSVGSSPSAATHPQRARRRHLLAFGPEAAVEAVVHDPSFWDDLHQKRYECLSAHDLLDRTSFVGVISAVGVSVMGTVNERIL